LGDLQQPTPVTLAVGYEPDEELKDFGLVISREPDGTGFGFGVTTNGPTTDLLLSLADGLQENFSELSGAWGQARPACPGHAHPAQPREYQGEAWWVCPRDGRPITSIGSLGQPNRSR
jgi:hypothetical protein